VLPDGARSARGYAHFARAHTIYEMREKAAELGLGGCRYCQRAYRTARNRGRSSLSAHEALCDGNPRRQQVVAARAAAAAAAAAVAAPAAGAAAAAAPAAGGAAADPGDVADLFEVDHAAWVAARAAFLQRVAPAAADWAPLVASGARTTKHVPTALLGAWRALAADALDWVRRQPEHARAWLWLLLLPSLVLHAPARAPADAADRPLPPLSHADRAAAVLRGDFVAALADRNAGVWRASWSRPVANADPPDHHGGQGAARATPSQRRALRLVRAGRLSAAARALCADPPAPQTAAVWAKARDLFPPASSATATTATVEAEFAAELVSAADFGDRPTVPRTVSREAVVSAIRSAPRAAAPGPSGLRPEHLWALTAGGQDALVAVVQLLAGDAMVSRVPPVAAHALSGADLLLLAKPGGVGADGLPGLRPIGMPETLRKLAASALAATVRTAAAELFAPSQLGVGVSSACERLLHELGAHVALHPGHAVGQYDYRNAFNLVSRAAAAAVLARALPVVSPYLQAMYAGEEAPSVYGWASGDDGAPAAPAADDSGDEGDTPDALPPPPPSRLCLPAERGAQQGDPLGPLLHAAALWLVLERLRAAHPGALVRAFHDDVVAAGTPAVLAAVMADAAAVGAAVDAELAPAKCVGWSPAGAAAPAGWTRGWATEGVVQFSVPLGGDDFVSAGVDAVAADHRKLVAAIAALPPAELQAQLLLLRLCAGPRANYWLRALPLVAGARLAAAVDTDSQAVLGRLLFDARDSPAVKQAGLARAALPPSMGGLGIGGRALIAPAAALASRVDALRAGAAYSPALRATADGLLAMPRVAEDGGPLAEGAAAAAAGAGGPPATGEAAGAAVGGAAHPPAARTAAAAAAGGSAAGGGSALPPPPPPVAAGAAGTAAAAALPASGVWFWGPDGVIEYPPPAAPADLDAPPPPPPPAPLSPPDPPAAVALRRDLLDLLDAHRARCVAPDTGLLWSRARGSANAAPIPGADSLAPLPPPDTTYDAGATNAHADGQHSPAPYSPPTWQSLLGGEARASQRDLSRPAHAAVRARIYAELSLWRRAGMAACQGGGAALWLSALPTPGLTGTAIHGAAMRASVRLWLGAPPRSVPPAPRCRCGRGADADGRHFLSACGEQTSLHTRLHHHLVHLVAEALRTSPSWSDVQVEAVVARGRGALRPDMRATHTASGVVVWGDASVSAPFTDAAVAMAAVAPLRAAAAVAREALKASKYDGALPATTHTFTPLVWEAFGRIGPATSRWLRDSLGGPDRSGTRATLLRRVSVALWRSHARAVSVGYSRCFGIPVVGDDSVAGGPLGAFPVAGRVGD